MAETITLVQLCSVQAINGSHNSVASEPLGSELRGRVGGFVGVAVPSPQTSSILSSALFVKALNYCYSTNSC